MTLIAVGMVCLFLGFLVDAFAMSLVAMGKHMEAVDAYLQGYAAREREETMR